MLEIKIKRLNKQAQLPVYAKVGDAGMDLTAISKSHTENYVEYGTGLAVEIPEGYMGLVFPRSSISKKDLLQCNSVGVIDSGYRGEILVRFKQQPPFEKFFQIGERIAQLIIIPHPVVNFIEVDGLSDSERGAGGFGHTGK